MATVRTDDTHYKNIAQALRQNLGADQTFTPAQMAQGVAQCAQRHFVATLEGNGEKTLSFHLPFAPDYLAVLSSDTGDLYGNTAQLVYNVFFDFTAFGLLGGVSQVTSSGGLHNIAMTTNSIYNRYSRADDGTVTLQNIGESYIGTFGKGRSYQLFAMKYETRSDAQRITAFVRGLTGSGSVTLNKAKVDAAFTAEEWAALAAEKPDWTFSFI